MIYLDSSALLKLLFEERESSQLNIWLSERSGVPRVSSELVRIEVVRAARRLDPDLLPAARTLISQLDLVSLNTGVLDVAAGAGEPFLRTLDAIHLASMLAIASDITAVLAYDKRLAAAAEAAGFEVSMPGGE